MESKCSEFPKDSDKNKFMKYDKLQIVGLPKAFELWDTPEYIEPLSENPDDIKYDMYPSECDEEALEDACVLFKYNESATGVWMVYREPVHALELTLSTWASDADVALYAAFVNAVLAKHKRSRLYDKFAPLPGLSEEDVRQMTLERHKYLQRLLKTKEGFTMEGVNACYTLKVAHLRPEPSIEEQAAQLQKVFVGMQWSEEDE